MKKKTPSINVKRFPIIRFNTIGLPSEADYDGKAYCTGVNNQFLTW
jgi:hypothetical protein